jgi:uncharacterized protein YndB with AHSA1/START domain
MQILSRVQKTMPNTVRLHRVLKAPREKVYRAFLDPAAMSKWISPKCPAAPVEPDIQH